MNSSEQYVCICGAPFPPEAGFCKKCGKPLVGLRKGNDEGASSQPTGSDLSPGATASSNFPVIPGRTNSKMSIPGTSAPYGTPISPPPERIKESPNSLARHSVRILIAVSSIAAILLLGLGYKLLAGSDGDPVARKQLAELQLLKVQIEQQKADLDAKAKSDSEKTSQIQKQLTETKLAEDGAKLQKQLEEAQERKLELERQQVAAEQRLANQRVVEQKLAEQRKATVSKVAALPPQPMPEAQAANPASSSTNEPARVITQGPLVFPLRAVQMGKASEDQIVRLKVFVGEQGQPLKVAVVEGVAGSWGYDEAAIDAANKSTYSPARRDGKPIKGWTAEITYKFQKRR